MNTEQSRQSASGDLQRLWFVYIVRCADASLYTGVTTDLARRVKEHNSTTAGARYTRGRRPVVLVYAEKCAARSLASKREHALKKLDSRQKQRLITATSHGDNTSFSGYSNQSER